MSSTMRRRQRTITVETAELGPVRVRRLSLGGMARIAERMRAQGTHDEIALGDALVAEVIVAGMDRGEDAGEREPDEFDNARLALLSEDDRRSIAAAVLTLEGVKAAGEGVREDPRTTLARRYSHVLDTRRHEAGGEGDPVLPPDADAMPPAGDAAVHEPQIALFGELAPATPPQPAQGMAQGARAAATPRAAGWERERERMQADIADLEALLARQAEQREALEGSVAAAQERAHAAQRAARRYRMMAAGLLAIAVVAIGAQFAWIGMLKRDVAGQRAQFDARLQAQQQALETAQREAADANARAERLAARRPPPAPAPKPAARPSAGKSAAKQPARAATGRR